MSIVNVQVTRFGTYSVTICPKLDHFAIVDDDETNATDTNLIDANSRKDELVITRRNLLRCHQPLGRDTTILAASQHLDDVVKRNAC